MPGFATRLQKAFRPTPGTAWLDILLLVLAGSILGLVLFGLVTESEPEYACAGPGPADFGCTGGWGAVVVGIFSTLQVLFFVLLFVVAAGRLISRAKDKGQ